MSSLGFVCYSAEILMMLLVFSDGSEVLGQRVSCTLSSSLEHRISVLILYYLVPLVASSFYRRNSTVCSNSRKAS
jgi:hypothetical protein